MPFSTRVQTAKSTTEYPRIPRENKRYSRVTRVPYTEPRVLLTPKNMPAQMRIVPLVLSYLTTRDTVETPII